MGRYASDTVVPVEKSRAEIEAVLIRYGATEFQTGWAPSRALIAFRIRGLFVRFILPIPAPTEKRFTHKINRGGWEEKRTDNQARNAHEQELRQRWRALLLTVKAKLEAVECGISTIEHEFLAFIVMPNELTVGEWLMESALPAIREGRMPLAIAGPKREPRDEPIDVEIASEK